MRFKAELLLLLTAIIWGTGFVAQRMGMEHVGPFTFNGVRFALGFFTLLPIIPAAARTMADADARHGVMGGLLLGIVLFAAVSLQQIGMVQTTAGNGGFITGLYVVLVPLLGLAFRQRPSRCTWGGVALAAAGLYLLSVREGFSVNRGDAFVFAGAFFWAAHVLLVGKMAPRTIPVRLAAFQFAVCSALSLGAAAVFEK